MKKELKNLADNLRKHDFKTELREAFQDARKAPSSLWKKPETPRPGKDIAIAGLAVAGVGLLLLLITSGAFLGVVCLILGLVAILAGLLGLKTEGRMLALAGTGASLLAILLAIGQIRSATRKPDPRDELIRLLTAQLAQSQGGNAQELAAIQANIEALKSAKSSGADESFEAIRARVAADSSLTVRPLNLPGLAPRSPDGKLLPAGANGAAAHGKATGNDGASPEPPAGPTSDRNKEIEKVLKKAKIETMTIDLPNKVGLLLSKLPDGSFMGTFEVTQDQWLAIMGGENPSAEDNVGDDHPVDSIWPADALTFVEKLNTLPDVKKAGLQFRIPSEEEWEKACLADAKRKRDFGLRLDGVRVESGREGNVGEIAWRRDMFSSSGMRHGTSHSVGRKQPNAFGLYDMHGNVEELTFARKPTIASRFASKGGYWDDGDDSCEAYRTGKHVYEEPVRDPKTGGEMFNYSLGLRVAASILDADIRRIFGAAEKMAKNGEAAFFGFYPGMSEEDAMHLAKHFGLSTDDELAKDSGNQNARNSGGVAMETPHCRFKVDPATKTVLQIRFDLPAILALTKKAYTKYKFGEFCEGMSKFIGKLECVQDGKNAHGYVDKAIVYQRKTSRGMIVSLEQEPKSNDPAVLLTLETLDKDIARILASAEKVAADGGAAFFGFYPGMSEADAIKLAGHYGLALGDDPKEAALKQPHGSYTGRDEVPGHCQFEVDPVTKTAIQIRFNLSAILLLTKETDCKSDFKKLCNSMAKYVGELECVQDGKVNKVVAGRTIQEDGSIIYQRKTSEGSAVSLEKTPRFDLIHLTLENTAAVASQAAAQMAAANNARIEAVEPVLQKAGIKTKTIELPGSAKLLLTELPNGRYMGTFEVTQAQYASLMGTNVSQCVGADLPVDSVTVQDCLDFIEKANELPAVKEEGLRFRLPSLADWATACLAGAEGDYTRRLDGTEVDARSLSDMMQPPADGVSKTAARGPHPVGIATPNAFGLYDMFGNVSEWVSDRNVNEYMTNQGRHVDVRQYHMGGGWGDFSAHGGGGSISTPKKLFEQSSFLGEKTSSIGFRVSVTSTGREQKRAKEEAAKAYALSNNGRIDAVKPVLEKAGIETKEIELPGGLKLLLNKLPDGSWAGAFEVTQGQWKSLLHDNPSSFKGDPVCTDEVILSIWRTWKDENPEKLQGTGLPVDQMSPGDIQTFLVLLNLLPSVREAGLTFHLPTQDEWLYIACAGAKSKYAKPLDGGDASVSRMGWYKKNIETPKSPRLQIVGQKQPNAYGLYDVHGNAAEFAESLHGGGHSKAGSYAMGGSVESEETGKCALARPIGGIGEKLEEFQGVTPSFTGFRVVATEGGLRHLVDPEMAAANNARIDAVLPKLAAMGIATNVLDLPGGVKLLLNKTPGGPWVGAFEVTQAQFMSILGENPSIVVDSRKPNEVYGNPWRYRTGDRPVDNVSKAGAEAFVRALSALPCAKEAGLIFFLPELDQWYRFCGAQWKQIPSDYGSDYGIQVSFPDGKRLLDMAWVGAEVGSKSITGESSIVVRGTAWDDMAAGSKTQYTIGLTQPVGSKTPNPYGLYDMIGNVWEWTSTYDNPGDDDFRKQHERQDGRTFFVSGASFETQYYTKKLRLHNGRFYSPSDTKIADGELVDLYRIEREKQEFAEPNVIHGEVGFRVWGWPRIANNAGKTSYSSTNSVAVAFVQDSNARIDAVKPVLKDAGIETKEVELPGGARILMNKLPNGAWIGAFEVTQAQFVSLVCMNPSRIKGGDRAVDKVSWNTATIYAALLNQLPSVKASGLHFRLPSSTEWETACRGGGGIAPQGKPLEKGKGKLDDMGWYDQNSDIEGVKQTHRVGLLQPNAFGLYDMIGNVAEWTSTAYAHESVSVAANEKGSRKIWRGGSWISPKERCTAAYRGLLPSDTTRPDTGFRLYATEDGSDANEESVTFRDKDFQDAVKLGPLPDDRSHREKLIGAFVELQQEMEKAEMQQQLEEVRSYLDLLDIDPAWLLL